MPPTADLDRTVTNSAPDLQTLTDDALAARLAQIIRDADAAIATAAQEDLSRYGLYDMLSQKEIATLLGGDAAPEILCQTLIDAANKAGGHDNITALVIMAEAPRTTHATGEVSEQPVTAPKKSV